MVRRCLSVAMAMVGARLASCARVLSIQSHTVRGYVGNKAAVFPMQLLGLEVDPLLTVHFSNRPGYKQLKGSVLEPGQLQEVLDAMRENDFLKDYSHVLTGYARGAELLRRIAALVREIKELRSDVVVLVDPVLGDHGRLYVPEENVPVYRELLLPLATIITPNQFEAETLSGMQIESMQDAAAACDVLHRKGASIVVITSLDLGATGVAPEESSLLFKHITMFTSDAREGLDAVRRYTIAIPKVEGNYVGCGDLFAALLLSHFHSSRDDLPLALEEACSTMLSVIQLTHERSAEELQIIQSAQAILKPPGGLNAVRHVDQSDWGTPTGIRGIIFDMDGTLTLPGQIDFARMRARLGLKPGEDILATVSKRPDGDQTEAYRIIEEEERLGLSNMKLQPDLNSTIACLRRNRVRLAIATRNMDSAVEHFLQEAGCSDPTDEVFTPRISRNFPFNKPDPRVAQHICREWNFLPQEVIFCGDHEDDMKCGRQAGCRTVLIKAPGSTVLDGSDLVDHHITTLSELLELLGVRN